jgi:hypothetical protein
MVETVDKAIGECSAVSAEIGATLRKSRKNTLGQLMLPIRDNKT